MAIKLLETGTPEEILQTLKENAERVENISYLKDLTEEDLALLKTELAVDSIQLLKLEEAKKDFLIDHKSKVKPLKQQLAFALHRIRTRVEEKDEDAYLIANHEEGLMQFFGASGDLIHSRELRPDERQLRISDTN